MKDAIDTVLGDAGYYSEMNMANLEQRKIDTCLSTERLKLYEKVARRAR